ncbi:MAG: glycosyltransferase [Pseudomonadota bacterium]|nr:glycosyltransferase [Pseudomonadota bacterium]
MSTQGVGDPWVGIELRAVRQAGLPARLHALNAPKTTFFTSPDFQAENRATNVLYPLSRWRAVRAALAAPVRFGPRRALGALWNALTGPRESLRTRAVGLWHYAVACHWAAALQQEEVSHIHSQWIHSGGTVAMYGAWLLDVPFSFTGHAADLFRNRAALEDKIRRAQFIVCISEFHRQFFLDNGARPEQLQIGYCGIDVAHFTPRRRTRAPGDPLHILSSGRLVEKKGFHVLIEACALLAERGFAFHCTIGGSGPEAEPLRALIAEKGLGDHVTLEGTAITQEDLPGFMYSGDVYCLPCVWAKDNDVDGLPVMLMEAMACGLPAVSTELVGIPDLIEDGETGLLVPTEDAAALADALVRLGGDEALAERLARAGRERVMAQFNVATCVAPTIARFRTSVEQGGAPDAG